MCREVLRVRERMTAGTRRVTRGDRGDDGRVAARVAGGARQAVVGVLGLQRGRVALGARGVERDRRVVGEVLRVRERMTAGTRRVTRGDRGDDGRVAAGVAGGARQAVVGVLGLQRGRVALGARGVERDRRVVGEVLRVRERMTAGTRRVTRGDRGDDGRVAAGVAGGARQAVVGVLGLQRGRVALGARGVERDRRVVGEVLRVRERMTAGTRRVTRGDRGDDGRVAARRGRWRTSGRGWCARSAARSSGTRCTRSRARPACGRRGAAGP